MGCENLAGMKFAHLLVLKRDEMEKLREVRVNADLTEFLFSKIITSYPSQQLR